MKQFFIVLLIAAIGVGVYFYLSKKQKTHFAPSQELIIGKWQLDSVFRRTPGHSSSGTGGGRLKALFDSSRREYDLEFRADGLLIEAHDANTQDTNRYQFTDSANILAWRTGDSTKTRWAIKKLDVTTLVVEASDSSLFYMKKLK